MASILSEYFTPPKLHTTDYVHEAKYILAYRLCLFLAVTIGLLMGVLFIYNVVAVLVSAVALVAVLFAIYFIRKTGNYFIPTLIFNLIGAASCQATFYLINDQPHVVDLLWIVINILFAFLVLGQRWGLGLSIFHAVSATIYYTFFMQHQLDMMGALTDAQTYSISTNMLLCFLIISYLSWQNIKTNDLAKKQLNLAQDVLQDQYNIISKQNEEKTVMLKEIHHRVKNNLQIITSLLRLQARELENPEAIAKFKDATHRVIAMSMIHEKMYQSDHLSTLHMKEYLHDLSGDLVTSYQSGYPVKLHIECDVDSIGLRSIVPLALILNELISNSLKYAFDEYDNCLISLSFLRYGENQCCLTYKDSGTWKAPSRRDSFGLDLIDSLTDQLEGTMKMDTFPETRFEFIFSPQED